MFKFHSLSTPILKKISISKSRSKRKRHPSTSNALFSACPLNVETALGLDIYKSPVMPHQIREEISTSEQDHPSRSTTSQTPSTGFGAEQVLLYYPDKQVFKAALELFNLQMEERCSRSSKTPQRWECKGKIRASFQLCVVCKDVGKVRSQHETYYLDVMEVRKNRTILCEGCMEHILYKHVGSSQNAIKEKLTHLQRKDC